MGSDLYHARLDSRSIRLLKIHPGSFYESIICDVIEVSLATQQYVSPAFVDYHSLSYVWGHQTAGEPILCNGHSISVTKNLLAALRQVRARAVTKFLWVDAICINQNDPIEKSEQVRLMPEIYSGASLVIHWLGERERDDDQAIRVLTRIATVIPYSYFMNLHENPPGLLMTGPMYNALYSGGSWTPLMELLGNEYFRRIWIVQELALAKYSVFLRGDLDIPALPLLATATLIYRHIDTRAFAVSTLSPDCRRSIANANDVCMLKTALAREVRCRLQDLLPLGNMFDASDPRDKVIALVGLAYDGPRHLVDYEKSLLDLYTDATMCVLSGASSIANNKPLDWLSRFLYDLPPPPGYGEEWPSWTPTFLKRPITVQLAQKFSNRDLNVAQVLEVRDSKMLIMQGQIIGRVQDSIPTDGLEGPPKDQPALYNAHEFQRQALNWYHRCGQLARATESPALHTRFHETLHFRAHDAFDEDSSHRTTAWLEYMQFQVDIADLCTGLGAPSLPYLAAINPKFQLIGHPLGVMLGRKLAWLGSSDRAYTSPSIMLRVIDATSRVLSPISRFFHYIATYLSHILRLRHPPRPPRLPLNLVGFVVGFHAGFYHRVAELAILARSDLYMYAADRAFASISTSLSNSSDGSNGSDESDGYIGWVPATAQSGDHVAVVQGCLMPFVLRLVGQAGQEEGRAARYRFVGAAYVHGRMDGVVRMGEEEGKEEGKGKGGVGEIVVV